MKILSKNVVINSRKFDHSVRRSWKADLIEKQKTLLVFKGIFKETIAHPFLGVIRRGTISFEYYWLDRWYNVFRFYEPDGSFRNYYCNINLPPVFQNDVLDFVDLDIDIIVWKDFSYQIHDLDDFEQNSKRFRYSERLKQNAELQLNNLVELIRKRDFPFNVSTP